MTGASSAMQVLFIGNSYTRHHDLPGLVAAFASTRGVQIERDMLTPGGCSLQRHFRGGAALEKLRARRWDVVVLQEQSTRPWRSPALMHEYARKFVAEIRAAGAKPLFYMTWARRDKPETQAAITKSYLDIGRELDAAVAPVGLAWQRALAAASQRVLHTADNSHPQPAGSYLAACVFFAVLLRQSPVGLPTSVCQVNLDETEAAKLQAIAWQTAQDLRDGTEVKAWQACD